MSIRLIAADLDGTLLDAARQITPRTARALAGCRTGGAEICFASGRSFEATRSFALSAGLADCLIISCNGARMDASPCGPVIWEDNLPESLAREAAFRLIRKGLYVECYSDEFIYMANRKPMKHRRHTPGPNAEGTVTFLDGSDTLLAEGPKKARKLIVFSDDPAELETARRCLSGLPLSLSQSGEDNLEIMGAGAGKGRALRWYAEKRGLARDEIMAFGDQTNDLDLLGAAGWPVAMGNAAEEVKARARLVAPRHDEDGVAQVLEKLDDLTRGDGQ